VPRLGPTVPAGASEGRSDCKGAVNECNEASRYTLSTFAQPTAKSVDRKKILDGDGMAQGH